VLFCRRLLKQRINVARRLHKLIPRSHLAEAEGLNIRCTQPRVSGLSRGFENQGRLVAPGGRSHVPGENTDRDRVAGGKQWVSCRWKDPSPARPRLNFRRFAAVYTLPMNSIN